MNLAKIMILQKKVMTKKYISGDRKKKKHSGFS